MARLKLLSCSLILLAPLCSVFSKSHNTSHLTETRTQNRSTSYETCTSGQSDRMSRQEYIEDVLTDYDRAVIPATGRNKALDVTVQLTIQSINEINQEKSYFEADVWFTQMWRDPSLQYLHLDPCRENISLPYSNVELIWFPNVCFVNSKRSRTHMSPEPNVRLLIFPNGTCVINYRVRVRGPCTMNLAKFPMDSQTCQLVFESYSYNSAEVAINWAANTPIKFSPSFNTLAADFQFKNVSWTKDQLLYSAGIWDQLIVDIHVTRMVGYYIVQAYMPTLVCLMMSWSAFFVDTCQLPARMTLTVSTLMVLTFIFGNISDGSPRVSYMRALDMWVFACMLFTFLSMVQLVLASFVDVLYTERKNNAKKCGEEMTFGEIQKLIGDEKRSIPTVFQMTLAYRIDMWSMRISLLLFTLFAAIYWWHYYFT